MARPELGPWGRRAVVLVVTVLVVLAATATLAVLSFPAADPAEDGPLHPEYDPASLAVEHRPADVENRAMPPKADGSGIVLIDKTHVNRFDEELVRSLESAITAAGYEVRFLRRGGNLERRLAEAEAFVVIDPATSFSAAEIRTVSEFVDEGGRLAIIGEPTRGQLEVGFGGVTLIDVRSQVHSLAAAFGIQYATEDLYAVEAGDGNFRNVMASGTGDHMLSEGVDSATFYTATSVSLEAEEGQVFLRSQPGTTISGGDTTGQFPVGVVSGNVVALGDKSFLASNKFAVADNDRIVANLAQFLTSGDRTRDMDDYPFQLPDDTTVRYTDEGFYEGAQTVANHLREAGGQPTVVHEADRVGRQGADVLVVSFEYLRTHNVRGVPIEVANGTVTAPGYSSGTEGVAVVLVPERGFNLVIAANSPAAAQAAIQALNTGDIVQFRLSDSVAVVTTNADVTSGDGNGSGGSGSGGSGGGPTTPPLPGGSIGMAPPHLEPIGA